IGFDVSGQGVTTPIHARIYIFGSHDAYTRRRADVDVCAGAWATDPPNLEFIDASPYVLVLQGPLPDSFTATLTRGLADAAGSARALAAARRACGRGLGALAPSCARGAGSIGRGFRGRVGPRFGAGSPRPAAGAPAGPSPLPSSRPPRPSALPRRHSCRASPP